MASTQPRLHFSHGGQDFIVKSRATLDGVEVRGFWRSRATARTRFFVAVPMETIQDADRQGLTDPVGQALLIVRDEIIAAIDNGESLADGA